MLSDIVLEVRGLETYFFSGDRVLRAVDGVGFRLERGKSLAIVGESGSGKTLTALSLLRLLPSRSARIVSGEIRFNGIDLMQLSEEEIRQVRGGQISMIFQDPMTALNPSLKVGSQVIESLLEHSDVSRNEAEERAIQLLARVGIADPLTVFRSYAHELSGGMRQRAIIAMALLLRPEVLIADEPTSALDVTTQEQIIELLLELQVEFNLSLILITHDLGVAARIAHDVLVMYAGRPVEYGDVRDVFYRSAHPYTRGLLDSADYLRHKPKERLKPIPGAPPQADELPSGCAFHPRCSYAEEICRAEVPPLKSLEVTPTTTACHLVHAGRLKLEAPATSLDPETTREGS